MPDDSGRGAGLANALAMQPPIWWIADQIWLPEFLEPEEIGLSGHWIIYFATMLAGYRACDDILIAKDVSCCSCKDAISRTKFVHSTGETFD